MVAEVVIIEPMNVLQAREYVQRINNRAAEMSRLLLELKDRQGWKALGYTSWHECVKNEFAYSSQHLYRLLDTAQVNQTIAGVLPGVNLPERHAREVKTFPQELQPAIVQIAQATAKAQGREATSGDYKRVGTVIQEAAITGAVDTGNGDSTPFTAALSVEQYEAMQRQQQQIRGTVDPKYDCYKFRGILRQSACPLFDVIMGDTLPNALIGHEIDVIVRVKKGRLVSAS